jgi:cytidine deaminase
MLSDDELIEKAREALNPRSLSPSCGVGTVACALISEEDEIFVGVCIDTGSSMGYCAEANAIGTMITQGESRIKTIVAVHYKGSIFPPCGRCREFIFQINNANRDTRVILGSDKVVTIADLLPYHEPEDA